MIESIAAYCDDFQTITVDVSRNFYQGDAGKFYLQHEDGKIERYYRDGSNETVLPVNG